MSAGMFFVVVTLIVSKGSAHQNSIDKYTDIPSNKVFSYCNTITSFIPLAGPYCSLFK